MLEDKPEITEYRSAKRNRNAFKAHRDRNIPCMQSPSSTDIPGNLYYQGLIYG